MTSLNNHSDKKNALLGMLHRLAELAKSMGMTTLAKDLTETRIPKLKAEHFNLVVLGEFNHGKSTFVNALLGSEILPTGVTPTTATINHVVHGEQASCRAILNDGTEKNVDLTELEKWATVDSEHLEEVRFLEVTHPSPLLRDNLVLVDTPGVNDLNEQRAEITYEYVPRADAVIFLLDATQALTESERSFLASRVLKRSRDRMLFVLGKADLLSDKEIAEVKEYVTRHLAPLLAEPPVFAVSAKEHLAGNGEASGMTDLIERIEQSLTEDRGRVILDNSAADAMYAAGYLQQNLQMKEQTLSLSLEQLTTRVTRVRSQLDATQKSLGELHSKIAAEGEAIKAQIRRDLAQFAEAFAKILPGQIDAVDAGDVRRYLPGFIQDKFKEWAEGEGEFVSKQLQALAEEVIAVTNQSTAQATEALSSRLGPDDAPLKIEVDSFKYDVSVYAVGALGTTVFLFVNSLVGGVLTLAAPILAIVFSSKVSAEIKDHAKEKAPKAIETAATAIGPHFEGIVNEFTEKLDDFVTSAGQKLYLGITEMLDQAIAERSDQGETLEPLAEATKKQISDLEAIRQEIESLRSDVWVSASSKG